MRRTFMLLALAALAPTAALAQSAGEVERCFQNPAVCGQGGGSAAPAPSGGGPVAAPRPAAPAPDYTTVLQSPDPDRRHIQESLRTLDKYNGPIDGNLQSEATTKAISDWQKAHGLNAVGKLTPQEAQQLNAEAAKAPIKRIEPPPQTAAVPIPSPQANADALKALQARLAERRKAAEPKAEAATQSLIRDLKAYVAADGKGVAGEQFAAFAKWYADSKAAGRRSARSGRRSTTTATPRWAPRSRARCCSRPSRTAPAGRSAWSSPGSRAIRARTRRPFPATMSRASRSGRPTRP